MTPGKADTSSSTYVSTLTMADGTVYGYSYDSIGNITRVTENGILKLSYQYDGQGQLIREDNAYANESYAFTYDGYGNILSKATYGYTIPDTEFPETATSTNVYSYENTNWPDQLTQYNGTAITYDEIGNPLSYNNGTAYTFTWQGRQLMSAASGENSYTYTYNSNGVRVQKTVNGVVHNYTVDGIKVLQETYNDGTEHILNFYYDENDSPIAFSINDTMYYYGKNLQGDVVKIYTTDGEVIAEYTYDAWGKLLTITDVNGNVITDTTSPAVVNPIRYRGYYYDTETGFYYLNSRYYDASVGRFLNADEPNFVTMDNNLFAYVFNNPINNFDPLGYFSIPRALLSIPLDMLFMYISPYLAPIKAIAKKFAGFALKTRLSTPLINLIKNVAKISSKLLGAVKNIVNKIPIWGKKWAKVINVAKLSKSIAGATTSGVFNFILDTIVPNITIFLSVGGFIAGFLDVLSDKKLNNKITIPFAW